MNKIQFLLWIFISWVSHDTFIFFYNNFSTWHSVYLPVFPLIRLWLLFICISVLNLAECLAYIRSFLGKSLNLFKPQFPHLYHEDKCIMCLIVLLWQTQVVYIKSLTWWLADSKPSINGSSYFCWQLKDLNHIIITSTWLPIGLAFHSLWIDSYLCFSTRN